MTTLSNAKRCYHEALKASNAAWLEVALMDEPTEEIIKAAEIADGERARAWDNLNQAYADTWAVEYAQTWR